MLPCYSCSLKPAVRKLEFKLKIDDNGGFGFNRTATEIKMNKIEERPLVENITTDVVVSFNFYQYCFSIPFGPFEVDGAVFWSC